MLIGAWPISWLLLQAAKKAADKAKKDADTQASAPAAAGTDKVRSSLCC